MTTPHADCLICTIRPSLNFCRLNILNTNYKCKHTSLIISRAKFKVSKTFQFLNLLCNIVLAGTVIKDLVTIYQDLEPQHLFTFMEVSINICVIYCNTSYILATKEKVKEYNGLLAIVDNKYGMDFVISEESSQHINKKMKTLITVLSIFELLNLGVVVAVNSTDFIKWMRVLPSELSTMALITLQVHLIQNSEIYTSLVHKCLSEIESSLTSCQGIFVSEKLQMMQRLYMALRRNFILSGNFFSPSAIVFYIMNTVLLIICQTYVVLLYFRGKVEVYASCSQIFVKSLVVVVGQIVFCFQSENLSSLIQQPMSFLMKFPLSRLSNNEASKVFFFSY